MNSTSPWLRFVSKPARSAAFSMIGPLVTFMSLPISRARMPASVVLPRPDGPLSRMWSSASLRCLAASTAMPSRSLTLSWPVNSENAPGRSVPSNAASGSVKTSVIIRSAMP